MIPGIPDLNAIANPRLMAINNRIIALQADPTCSQYLQLIIRSPGSLNACPQFAGMTVPTPPTGP